MTTIAIVGLALLINVPHISRVVRSLRELKIIPKKFTKFRVTEEVVVSIQLHFLLVQALHKAAFRALHYFTVHRGCIMLPPPPPTPPPPPPTQDMQFMQMTLLYSIPLSSVHIPGYTLYRKDRNLHGGGVCIYVHTRFHSHAQPITSSGIECLFVRLRICTNPRATDLIICSVYRPPSTSVDFWESYSQQLDTATRHTSNIIVLGGLNTDILQPSRTGHYSHLRSLCEEFNLRNVVTVPTRLGKTCLDLALVYKDAPHTNTTVHCLDGISDHDLVIVKFAYVITPPVQTMRKYVRKPSACTVDPNVFGDDLKAQLFDFPASSNASAQADQLATCIGTVLNNHAPKGVVRPAAFSKPKPHPWLTDRLKYLLQQRTHLHRKVRAHPAEQQLLQKYRAVRR